MNDSVTDNRLETKVDLVIKNHVLGASAVGIVPAPLVDLAGLTLLNAAMVKKISELYGHPTSDRAAMNVVIGLTGGLTGMFLGPSLVRSLFKLVPGIGAVSGSAAMSLSAGTVTYALGRLLQQHFEGGGEGIGPVTDDLEARFQEEMEKGRGWVSDTLSNARNRMNRRTAADGSQDTPATEAADADAETETETAPPATVAGTDDLRKIEGIGPKIAGLCNAAGIHSFADMAAAEIDTLQHILDEAGPRYRLADPSTWPKQAALAAAGQWEELDLLQDHLKGGREVS